jgi:hypothetical protein
MLAKEVLRCESGTSNEAVTNTSQGNTKGLDEESTDTTPHQGLACLLQKLLPSS